MYTVSYLEILVVINFEILTYFSSIFFLLVIMTWQEAT